MRTLGLVLIGVLTLAAAATATPAASLGSAFADAYAAFAPLYEFYRSYADYLFAGTPVAIPAGLESACTQFPAALETLQFALVTQTASAPAETLGHLVRLRGDAVLLCNTFGPDLEALAQPGDPDLDRLAEWSDAGLFVSIYEANRTFETALNAALDAAGNGRERWELAVTFAVRGLLLASDLVRVSGEIDEILYGAADASAPPFPVPTDVAEAMATLVARAGLDLADGERAGILAAAERIYEYFMSGG